MSRLPKVRKLYDATRSSPFKVSWTIDKKRHSRFFQTEEEQEAFAMEIAKNIHPDRAPILKLDNSAINDIIAIDKMRGNTPFMAIWEFYERHHRVREVVSLLGGADAYIRSLRLQDFCESYIVHARLVMERLCQSYGDQYLEAIRREHLETWLDELPFGAVTKKNYRSTIRAAWTFFDRKEWIDKNIAVGLRCPKIIRGEVGILTVEETEKLFRANEHIDPEVCGLLALGFFAGMRTSAISRVEYHEIDFVNKGINTPAHKTKKGRRNFIQNLPDNIWAWLERTPESAFDWCERKWKKRREIALRRAGLLINSQDVKRAAKKGKKLSIKIPPHNAMRHSFASYHVAWKRDFQDTALIISHKGTTVLFNHYVGVATKENAERYFNIYPSSQKK